MWMMCLESPGGEGARELSPCLSPCSWPPWQELAGDKGSLLSDISEGDGVLGGVSMEGMGWSLKQADS